VAFRQLLEATFWIRRRQDQEAESRSTSVRAESKPNRTPDRKRSFASSMNLSFSPQLLAEHTSFEDLMLNLAKATRACVRYQDSKAPPG